MAPRAQVAWFHGLAAGGLPQISAGDGFAVSTGLDSNTDNGAVIAPSVLDNSHELDALLVWLREKADQGAGRSWMAPGAGGLLGYGVSLLT